MENLKKLLEVAEELDWICNVCAEENPKRNYIEMQKYSPAGEDFYIIVDFNDENPIKSFLENLEECCEYFDPDEHAEMWVGSRGKNGVPNTIRELIDDADAIKEMIGELCRVLKIADMVIKKIIK